MSVVIDRNGRPVSYEAAVNLMDDELRELLHANLVPCSEQEFYDAYLDAHLVKYGEEFRID
jgi:hypothetical protein